MNFVAHSIKLGTTYDVFMPINGGITQMANINIMPIIRFLILHPLPNHYTPQKNSISVFHKPAPFVKLEKDRSSDPHL